MQVPLGIVMKNEMEYSDMLDILQHIHAYIHVPTSSTAVATPYLNPVTGSVLQKNNRYILFCSVASNLLWFELVELKIYGKIAEIPQRNFKELFQ